MLVARNRSRYTVSSTFSALGHKPHVLQPLFAMENEVCLEVDVSSLEEPTAHRQFKLLVTRTSMAAGAQTMAVPSARDVCTESA